MIERREYVRIGEAVRIGYRVISPPDGQGKTHTEDIGGGGIRFPVAHRIMPGTILDLKIFLPKITEPISSTGEVVWWRGRSNAEFPFMVGIKFITIDEFDRGKIINYIRKAIQDRAVSEIQWIE